MPMAQPRKRLPIWKIKYQLNLRGATSMAARDRELPGVRTTPLATAVAEMEG